MPSLTVHTDGENCWPDLAGHVDDPTKVVHLIDVPVAVARLPGGMASGASRVAIRLPLPDGRALILETSLALFVAAGKSLEGAEAYAVAQATKGAKA